MMVNINPGKRYGMMQAYTITVGPQIFFLTHDLGTDQIIWGMIVDVETAQKVEKILRNYLTNQ